MKFLDLIREKILIGDGAIGTMLYSKGVGLDANFEHLNLVRPSLVSELHREYLAAGARVIETNTFGANYTRLEPIGLEKKAFELNRQGAILARNAVTAAAVGEPAFVAGSIGPLVRLKGEERELGTDQVTAIFREQVAGLMDGGVDLFILETFSDLEQIICAMKAAKETGLPVVASMAYQEGERTGGGVDAVTAAARLTEAGADIVGANCGAGPREILLAVRRMATATGLPLAAFANSGFPEYLDGRYIYRTTPEYFADKGAEMAAAGAALIGGCCGTTPDHIRQLSRRLQGAIPQRIQRAVSDIETPPSPSAAPTRQGFLSRWGKAKIVTVELDPPRGLDCEKIIAGSRVLRDAGADAINIAENPLARVRMGNIALAHKIQQEVGIEVIVHITCRDRNLLGLQSDLMGASLLGIRSILAVTGDPARLGDQTGASSVFDLNSFGLIKLISDLNSGVNGLGQPLGGSTGFTIGCAFNPNTPKMEVQVARLEKKIAAGARFIQTQPLYDAARAAEMAGLTAKLGIPLLMGIMPLVGERNCEYLHNEVPGIAIPDAIRARMKGKEKEEGAAEGLAIARELIDSVRSHIDGFYLIAPFGRSAPAAELVRYIKEG
ncbi:MAG TPA: bifunctional homocysteine S-methyltransferase/methylenetetrahydrofolate reductase [Geobacteraceae bacterium]|nr:bifunctional homocysteine S-methyltransferase/methylenetetrahydrofolate reductase [Geobacteraceae bacterium]